MKKSKYLYICFMLLFSFYNCSQENDLSKEVLVQSNYSIPSVKETQQTFQQTFFSKNTFSKSEKQLDILWEESSVKKYKEDINILHTPIDLNSEIRIKSLVSSVEKEGVIESYILTLVYDEDSNNQAFSGYIFKHDNKGAFIEVYQYKQGTYIQTLKEINTSKNFSNRGCSCSTSVLEVVQLLQAGWDVGGLLDCVCVGGTTGGGSSTFQEWSTPGSKLKDPIGWHLGHNNTLGGGGGSTTGNTSNSNNNISNELEVQDIKPWWNEDDKIINNLTDKAKCVYDKLKNNTLIKKTLDNFKGEDAPVHLKLEMKSNLRDNKGDIINGQTIYGDKIRIVINTEKSKDRPSLSVARTIIHEAIHAKIYRMIRTRSQLVYNQYTNTYHLPDGSKADFPTLFDYYDKFPNNPQHNYMADYYRTAMEESLKEYAKLIGKTYPNQLYKDLAWIGLHNTKAWDNMYADKVYTKNEQLRIIKSTYKFNKSGNNECD
ncbi:hypothetical protein [uncultured Tenacibaculum sp.]|uniref:hypothetical protein n=1 Tax=uncultured Tenacibaculum sp. TaxID=174713 RepID=UPI00262AF719|nr:hypothetical protein [uncultured Tenacibaculum sp.]